MDNRVYIFDTTLRDGEQVPGCQLNTQEKIVLARELESLGVDIIEAGFPISSPGDFQSVVEISRAVSEPVICALTRAVEGDIDCAAEALQYAKRKRIHTGIGVSDMHIRHKFNSSREGVLERAERATKYAKRYVEDVEFYCEDAGRADPDFLVQMVETVIRAGATVVNIPDTTGYCLPDQYGGIIRLLRERVSNIDQAILSVHCHNDLGLATANTISGLANGARQAEVTINGIGERAGNTSLEETVMILKSHYARLGLDTGINTRQIAHVSRQVSRAMRMPLQPNKAVVGRNAFAHSSGIHQDGVLKHRENYETIDPTDVGINRSTIFLTARSGRHALKHRLERLGFQLEGEELATTYQRFLVMADQTKEVHDDHLMELMGVDRSARKLELQSLAVHCGKSGEARAEVTLHQNGEDICRSAVGNGPIDATFKAIDQVAGIELNLEEYLVQAITEGSDDIGQVHVQLSVDGEYFHGFGSATDIIQASAIAYLDGINKIIA